ncbi:MAG: IS110 family transposase [Gammaproteobacteria bacterium RIFOXYA12_FULL_61_12]|nr:MAG: IS110 family transposase [Gammaproteobacteria bacterium RIFOXYD12_FULL_61_37]OGT93789.1 MAG: IS110 family transposase [Gammaproteobacteria bacterium RIFOXYA12_FULL_61_12]
MKITTVGFDLAKNVFQAHGVDERGQVKLKKTLKRAQVLPFFANLPPCRIGMEACAGAHYWARELAKQGHEVKLIAPQFVKPYVKGNKNDANDAEAICEAVGRPNMRFVPVKTVEQQDLQALHRVRSGLVKERTATVNQTRGLLGEYGIVIGKGITQARRRLPEILEDAENNLSDPARELFAELRQQIVHLDEQVAKYQSQIEAICRESAACRKLLKVNGIGPLSATAMVASVGDGSAFERARQVPAWLGLTPRQASSGGKERLLGISKRGDSYLRTLLIHGARAVVKAARNKDDAQSRWINDLVQRRNQNIAAVAVANKNARIAWALLTGDADYRAPVAA